MSEHVIPRTKVARIYNYAARLLRDIGWIQNESVRRDSDGNYLGFCLGGAITHAVSKLNLYDYENSANQGLNNLSPRRDFVGFNDNPETTLDDVLVLLHEAQDRVLEGTAQLTYPDDDEL